MPPNQDLPIDEQAFLLLSQTYALSRKMIERALAPSRITLAEYTLLRIVENTPRITAGESRKRLFATAPSVAQLVASLEGKRLIARTADKNDTRRLFMTLTGEGSKRVQTARKDVLKTLRAVGIGEQTLRSLIKSLTTCLSSLSPYGS